MSERRQILVVEDDASLSEAMCRFFEKEKLEVHQISLGSDIRKVLEQNPIGLIVADCLLPDGSGVEILAQLKKSFPYPLSIVLMSGIFMEQSFVKESVRSTQALGFLKKPFDLSQLMEFIPPDSTVTSVEAPPRQQLYSLFRKPEINQREKHRALEALDSIEGYDLPFIYSLLVETKASGFLNIAASEGNVFGVTFSEGHIQQVDIPDKNTYLGALLVAQGFVSPEDLASAMDRKGSSLKLGQRLIQENLVSPHALDQVVLSQMNIRLSQTIRDEKYQINFVDSEIERNRPSITPEIFATFLHDWIAGKLSLQWLKTHFLPWLDSQLMKGPHFSNQHPVLLLPLVRALKGIDEVFEKGLSLNQILDSKKWDEESLYKVLFLLLTKGLIVFKDTDSQPQDRIRSFQKIQDQVRGKNKLEIFETLSQMLGVSDKDPSQVLSEFRKLLASEPSRDLRLQHQQLLRLAEEACDFAKKSNRDRIRKELSKDDVDMRLKAANSYEEAKALLQKSQFRQAFELLKKVSQVDPSFPELKLHLAWARMASVSSDPDRTQILGSIEVDLLQIPPEEKTSSLYHFVMGLNFKYKGDLGIAKKQFEKALFLDPQMMVARREMNLLKTVGAEKKNVMDRDLKDLVGSFFKKGK
ncbi:MAG: response regulator [Bdellovibrio sp.]